LLARSKCRIRKNRIAIERALVVFATNTRAAIRRVRGQQR
jgi:hypothetical protein